MALAPLWQAWTRQTGGLPAVLQPASTSPASITFPPGTVGGAGAKLCIRVRIALGADLSALDTWWQWNWVDISTYVRFSEAIEIRVGKTERSDTVTPGELRITLDNRDGRFSRRNPNSPYFGLLTRNTPIWVEVNPGSGWFTRAQMFVNEWPTTWPDQSANDTTVRIVCSGILRRLKQASESRSPLRRAIMAADATRPVLYLPCEDGPNATALQLVYGDSARIPKPRLVTLGDSAVAGKASIAVDLTPQPDEPSAASLKAVRVRTFFTASAPSYVKIGFTFRGNLAPTPRATMAVVDVRIFNAFGGTGSFGSFTMMANWDTALNDFKQTSVQWSGQGGFSASPIGWNPFDGQEHYIEMKFTQNGASTDQELWLDNIFQVDSHSYANVLDTPTELWLRPGAGSIGGDTVDNTGVTVNFSNITLYTSSAAPNLGVPGTAGKGETVNDRVVRLCVEDGVPLVITSQTTGSPAMGPQPFGGLVDLLDDAMTTGQGVVYENGYGLGYQTRSDRENQAPWLALDFNSRHVAETPTPVDDDRDTRNKWTVTRDGGQDYTSELTSGSMGTAAGGPGIWPDETTVSVHTDDLLVQQASYRTWRDTVDADRYPNVALNLMSSAAAATLIPSYVTMPYGARITMAHPPDTMAPDTIDVIADGYSERFDPLLWQAALVCFPNAVINHVFRLAETTGDADEFLGYLTFDSCVLAEDLDTTETGVDVTTTGALWETAADNWSPGALIVVDGETMRITSVSGASNPQTLTVTRSVNGVVKTHASGAMVDFVSAGALGL